MSVRERKCLCPRQRMFMSETEILYVRKTQYIRHLRTVDSCGLPEVRELQISR